jgi:Domain of unknown function (DUF4411)
MTTEARFVLDANVFIQAHRAYYAFDVCPGYWKALLAHHTGARLCSIDRIRGELLAGKDALADWVAEGVPEAFFANTDDPTITSWFAQMMTWVQSRPQFSAAAKAEFAAKADGWLVAYGRAFGCKVVTLEIANPNIQRKVPIPNLCDAFGVEYTNTFDMLRALATRFEWQGG